MTRYEDKYDIRNFTLNKNYHINGIITLSIVRSAGHKSVTPDHHVLLRKSLNTIKILVINTLVVTTVLH